MNHLLNFIIGLTTGILSGFGIGGGSLLILYLTCFTGMPQYTAGGINLLYFLFCAPAALISHIKNRLIDKKTFLLCTAAGIPSSLLAALFAAHAQVGLLRRIFGILLIFIGVKELFINKINKNDK
ncbi:MAG: sulfite exporter TauE/SafE family protein [Oscillospiraceae bacterium]|nr:sulfite exporter TauE/SafE family protein [Oscillospiraceae bacterium]